MSNRPILFLLLLTLILVLLVAIPSLAAEDRSAATIVTTLTQAMAGSDSGAKRAALLPLVALGQEYDDIVYLLLVKAVGDQQTRDIAIPALRTRSGLNPTFFDHGPGYPGYPQSDAPADWNAWLAYRTGALERERTLADQSRRLAALEAAAARRQAQANEPANAAPAPSDSRTARTRMPPDEAVEGLSRIIFTDGATMVGRIVERHRDANGHELTLEFIHRDGTGREVIPFDRIARIESYVP